MSEVAVTSTPQTTELVETTRRPGRVVSASRFLFWRLSRIALSLLAVTAITFVLLQAAPGKFADIQALAQGSSSLGSSRGTEAVNRIAERYGDDMSAPSQYLSFLEGALTWDFGPSYEYSNQDVEDIIATAFPISATLALLAVSLALAIGVPVGVLAALRHNRALDHVPMLILTFWYSFPAYLASIILMLVLSAWLNVLPSSGWGDLQNMVMPVLALGLGPAAMLARYVRSSVLETLTEPYVATAYAKGGRGRTVVVKHVLRNSLIPMVTVLGPLAAGLMTGTVFVETVFRVPGLGKFFVDAARVRDMPLLMATSMLFALVIMVMNLVVDLVYGLLDPRVREDW